jgi:hypothetical protein
MPRFNDNSRAPRGHLKVAHQPYGLTTVDFTDAQKMLKIYLSHMSAEDRADQHLPDPDSKDLLDGRISNGKIGVEASFTHTFGAMNHFVRTYMQLNDIKGYQSPFTDEPGLTPNTPSHERVRKFVENLQRAIGLTDLKELGLGADPNKILTRDEIKKIKAGKDADSAKQKIAEALGSDNENNADLIIQHIKDGDYIDGAMGDVTQKKMKDWLKSDPVTKLATANSPDDPRFAAAQAPTWDYPPRIVEAAKAPEPVVPEVSTASAPARPPVTMGNLGTLTGDVVNPSPSASIPPDGKNWTVVLPAHANHPGEDAIAYYNKFREYASSAGVKVGDLTELKSGNGNNAKSQMTFPIDIASLDANWHRLNSHENQDKFRALLEPRKPEPVVVDNSVPDASKGYAQLSADQKRTLFLALEQRSKDIIKSADDGHEKPGGIARSAELVGLVRSVRAVGSSADSVEISVAASSDGMIDTTEIRNARLDEHLSGRTKDQFARDYRAQVQKLYDSGQLNDHLPAQWPKHDVPKPLAMKKSIGGPSAV